MKHCLKTILITQAIVLASLSSHDISIAQVIPDSSLPTNSSIDLTSCSPLCTITDGTTQGTNLFHSFTDFSLPTGSQAQFNEASHIEIIIGRITGNNLSNIDGTLGTNQASLFLLNPNGFIFGPNASLDIGGSFIASTAATVQFQDGNEFQVDTTRPLLSMSAPVGVQIGTEAGEIHVGTPQIPGLGNQLYLNPNGSINRTNQVNGGGLSVDNGHTLALLANNLAFVGGNLAAAEGHIELGSVNDPNFITLGQDGDLWTFDYGAINSFSDITFTQAAAADVSGNSSGSLQVVGHNITLSEGSALIAETLGNGTAGLLNVQAESLTLQGISPLDPPAAPPVPGLPPNVPLVSGMFANVALAQSGAGSDLTITTQNLSVTDGAQVTAATFGSGDSGNLTVNAQEILLTGGTEAGPSGLLAAIVSRSPIYGQAAQDLVDTGLAQQIPPTPAPLLFALPPVANGNSGNLTINTQNLSVQNGAQIYSISAGFGNAGRLTIQADTIDVDGSNPWGPSALLASAEAPIPGAGSASDIAISTRLLQVNNGGQISTGTLGPGNAGNVFIDATESVILAGVDESGRSGIFSSAISLAGFPVGTGQGGNVTINAPRLEIREGANISASNFPSTDNPALAPGVGTAGTINLNMAGNSGILLLDQGEITAAASLENGGNINLQAQDIVLLRNQSRIIASAGTGGAGGNIAIIAPLVVAIPQENSDIIASALNGPGGNIEITASSVFSLQERPAIVNNGTNDIDASSQFGLDGTVTVQTPALDLEQGLTGLSTKLVDRSMLFSQGCGTRHQTNNNLIFTGRGGLPSQPGYTLEDTTALADFGPLDIGRQRRATGPQTLTHTVSPMPLAFPTTEAQSLAINEDGQTLLVAQPSQMATAHSSYLSCQS